MKCLVRITLHQLLLGVGIALVSPATLTAADDDVRREDVATAIAKAGSFYRSHAAAHGGYVYHYLPDFSQRWGEGEATRDQVWVQPPGTPTVGMAFLQAYEATGDPAHLSAATDAAQALVYGQLQSGGWTNCIDFDPRGERTAAYRNGRGRGKNNSSLDDGQTQSAIQLLVRVDGALGFRNEEIHRAAMTALDALLAAQFPNGGFPQVWTEPVSRQPILKASYPDYDWRTDGRVKEYWTMYTLNDNVTGFVADTLIDAHRVYDDEKYLTALQRLGDFLLLAQMPEPQPGWAQQYNYDMKPIWARRFEPPGVSGDETQEVIETLMTISRATGDRKYLEPIPRALAWLKRSALPDGRLARYYELRSNKPLYMTRRGNIYSLTYDDSELPGHYGWKWDSRVEELEARLEDITSGESAGDSEIVPPTDAEIRGILDELDGEGRWVSRFDGELTVGQLRLPVGTPYLSSDVFSRNLTSLSQWLIAHSKSSARQD